MKLILATVLSLAFLFQQDDADLSKELRNAWERAFVQEELDDSKLARFFGFVEGRFGIEVPRVWTADYRGLAEGNIEIAFELQIDNSTYVRVSRTESEPKILFRDATCSWEKELADLTRRVIYTGPWVFYSEVIVTKDKVLVFGKCGRSIRFLRVLSRRNGNTLAHFSFSPNSKDNLGEPW